MVLTNVYPIVNQDFMGIFLITSVMYAIQVNLSNWFNFDVLKYFSC
jgi:hypothetical protein